MANYQTAYYRDRAQSLREKIVKLFGGFCAFCGRKKRLQLDHIKAETRTWIAKKCSQMGRARRYWRDYQNNLLQVLCKKCNQIKGDR